MSRRLVRHLDSEAVERVEVVAGYYRAARKVCKMLDTDDILDYHLLGLKNIVEVSSRH